MFRSDEVTQIGSIPTDRILGLLDIIQLSGVLPDKAMNELLCLLEERDLLLSAFQHDNQSVPGEGAAGSQVFEYKAPYERRQPRHVVHYTCKKCGAECQRIQVPGFTPSYCDECRATTKPSDRRDYMREYMRAYRKNRRGGA